MPVVTDIIDSATVTETGNGFETTRRFHVEGLVGSRSARLFSALLFAGVPRVGTFHPFIGDISVVSRTARPTGAKGAYVTCVYRRPDKDEEEADETEPAQITVGSSVTTVESTLDAAGDPVIIEYTLGGRVDTQGVTFSILVPQTVLRLTRKEEGSPGQKSIDFVGTTNKTSFVNTAPNKWLCMRLEGVSADGGITYLVTYEFQLDSSPEGWSTKAVYKDPISGKTPSDVTDENGILLVEVYRRTNFEELNLGI